MERFQLYSCKLAGSDEYIFETIALTETDFMNADQLTKGSLHRNICLIVDCKITAEIQSHFGWITHQRTFTAIGDLLCIKRMTMDITEYMKLHDSTDLLNLSFHSNDVFTTI